MQNIKKLYDIMYNVHHNSYDGWASTAFYLQYHNIKCTVLCEQTNRLNKQTHSSKYWLLMKFFDDNKSGHNMYLYVCPDWIKLTSKDKEPNVTYEIIDYFGINHDFVKKYDKTIERFCNQLNKAALEAVKHIIPKDPYLNEISYDYIDSKDYNPNKRYCYEIKDNGGHRSEYNDNKTQYLRHTLYDYLMSGSANNLPKISFVYSDNKDAENSDNYIIRKARNDGTLNTKK